MKSRSIYILSMVFFLFYFLSNFSFPHQSWADSPPPIVSNSYPENDAVIASSVKVFTIEFVGGFAMDPNSTADAFSFKALYDQDNELKTRGNLNIEGCTLTFTLNTYNLINEQSYKIKIKSTAKDIGGNSLDTDFDGYGGEEDEDDWSIIFYVEDGQSTGGGEGWSKVYDNTSGLPEYTITSMVVDTQNQPWVGTDSPGTIYYFDGNNWQDKTPYFNDYQIDKITSLTLDNQGKIWAALLTDADQDDPNMPKVAVLENLSNNTWSILTANNLDITNSVGEIRDLTFDIENNLWIILNDDDPAQLSIIKYLDGVVLEHYTSNSGLPDDWVTALTIDENNNIWIGAYFSGLYMLKNGTSTWDDQYTFTNQINSPSGDYRINDLVIGETDKVWLGTNNGLLGLDPNTSLWIKMTTEDDLPSNDIKSLAYQAEQKILWIGTSYGLAKYPGSSGEDVIISFTGDLANGVSNEAITALALNSRGEVWFGTNDGKVQLRDEVKPSVVSSFPAQNGDKMDVDEVIEIVFSEPMDQVLTENAFIILKDTNDVEVIGAFSWENNYTLVFTPEALSYGQGYIFSVSIEAQDLQENSLDDDYDVLFYTNPESSQTDKIPPYYIKASCSLTTLVFTILDDGVGVKKDSITVKVKGQEVEVITTQSGKGYKVTYSPTTPFNENEEITVIVNAEDEAGNQLKDETFTVTATPPPPRLPLSGSGCFIDTLLWRWRLF